MFVSDASSYVGESNQINHKGGKSKYGFNVAVIRSKVFSDTAKVAKPDIKYINRYKTFLEQTLTKVTRKQLKISTRVYNSYGVGGSLAGTRSTNKHLGYATGNLQNSVQGKVKVYHRHDKARGKYNVSFQIWTTHLNYGNYISRGRKASYIPIWALIDWIETKIQRGSFRISLGGDGKDGDKKFKSTTTKSVKTREAKIKSIAHAISNAASKRPKPPVLKSWNNITENKRLRTMFDAEIDKYSVHFNNQIRKSIIKNTNIKYGN